MRTLYHRLHLPFAIILGFNLFVLTCRTASAHSVMPAHAKVTKVIPAIGSTIELAPTTVTVFALENINPDPKKSNLFIYSPASDLISQGNATVSLSNPEQMSIPIKPDAAHPNGVYVVQWKTVSAVDGDPDQGAFVFMVNTGAVSTPTPVATSTTGQTTTPITTNTGGTPLWVPVVVGIIALLVGLVLGLVLGRGQSASTVGKMRKAVIQQSHEEDPSKHQ